MIKYLPLLRIKTVIAYQIGVNYYSIRVIKILWWVIILNIDKKNNNMKTSKIKLPKKNVTTVYSYQNSITNGPDTTATSQGDPTNGCTTILTTTHFV